LHGVEALRRECSGGAVGKEDGRMTLTEIKAAVESGRKVYWCNKNYEVVKDDLGRFLVWCLCNNSYIGLTWRDGVTLNGSEDQFFTDKV
jgi:hypothetical protein